VFGFQFKQHKQEQFLMLKLFLGSSYFT